MPELIWKLCFKMAKEAILNLEVNMVPKLYNFYSSVLSMSEIVENYISFVHIGHMVPKLLHCMFFQDGDGGHLGFRGQDGPKTLQLQFQCIWHARNSGKGHLICPSRSSGARAITIYVFQDGVGGHFEYCAIKKVPITFQRFIGAYFLFKWFLTSNPSKKKGSK